MQKKLIALSAGILTSLVYVTPTLSAGSFSAPPKARLSADLSSPWLLQYKSKQPRIAVKKVAPSKRKQGFFKPKVRKTKRKQDIRAASFRPQNVQRQAPAKRKTPSMEARFLPQVVSYSTSQAPGTVIIETSKRYLYLVMDNGKARRYGVGVGREGFTWSGTQKITRKAEWPGWTPPPEMIEREKAKGINLPTHMPGGPDNPLGARALYLGNSLYRIHGTTQPWTIGKAVSSGCIRMRNEDVIDFHSRVRVGTKVIVR